MKPFLILTIASLLSFTFLSCSISDDSGNSTSIESVSWVIENIDHYYWSDGPSMGTAYISFWIKLESNSLVASDISSFTIYSPSGTTWKFDDQDDIEYYFDTDQDYIGGWLRLYSSTHLNTVELGSYEFIIKFVDAKSTSYTLDVPAPGTRDTTSYTYCYTENCYYSTSIYKALPHRASNINCTINGSDISVEFTVNNDIIYNAYLRFYDNNNDILGYSKWVRDFGTGVISSQLNNGSDLFIDGNTNTFKLSSSDIIFYNGYEQSDIKYIRIILSDGKQYSGENTDYDTRSISELTECTIH